MTLIPNYKDEAKRLINESYEPADILSKEVKFTTGEMVDNLKTFLPESWVDDHFVYEVLTELGYKPQEENSLRFFWYFKKRNNV
ncbi:MAG: hypothetical protein EOO07_18840 [Chitinophagaceae bacterium]|nr:MAG: hypothetical protein EOO07_18840 [Chitinophagaceae bacterium]